MNIVIDGLSGVGKTTIGTKLAVSLGMPFYEFLPDMEGRNEVSLHAYSIQRQSKSYKTVIEGSYIMSLITKHFLHSVGLLTTDDLVSIHAIPDKTVADCIIIYIDDSLENIRDRRLSRGRPFEYTPELGDLIYLLDEYVEGKYIDYITNITRPNITFIRYNRSGKEADEVVRDLVELLPEVLLRHSKR